MIKLLKNYPTGPNIVFILFSLSSMISIITGLIAYINTDKNMITICSIFLTITVIISFYISYKQENITKKDFNAIRKNDIILIENKSNWVKSNSFKLFKEDHENVYILDKNKIYTIKKDELKSYN